MLHVIAEACEMLPDNSKGSVVLESDCSGPPFHAAFEELSGRVAIDAAMSHAALLGMGSPYLNGNIDGPYPVNSEGLPLDMVRDSKGGSLPVTHPRMQVYRYRVTVPLTRSFR